MKRKITVAVEKSLLDRARAVAAKRGISLGDLVRGQLENVVRTELKQRVACDAEYQQAKARALALMASGFHLGGRGIRDRDALHDRAGLRTARTRRGSAR